MSSLASSKQVIQSAKAQTERRRSSRLLVEIPVGFRTVSGLRECSLSNISDVGAMLEVEHPPAQGTSGWLVMGEDEVYCTVVWSSETTCGIEFERGLPTNQIDQIVGGAVRELGPAANRGNIQPGRKRSSLVSGRS